MLLLHMSLATLRLMCVSKKKKMTFLFVKAAFLPDGKQIFEILSFCVVKKGLPSSIYLLFFKQRTGTAKIISGMLFYNFNDI